MSHHGNIFSFILILSICIGCHAPREGSAVEQKSNQESLQNPEISKIAYRFHCQNPEELSAAEQIELYDITKVFPSVYMANHKETQKVLWATENEHYPILGYSTKQQKSAITSGFWFQILDFILDFRKKLFHNRNTSTAVPAIKSVWKQFVSKQSTLFNSICVDE